MNDADFRPIDRQYDMLMVERSLTQFIHPTERFCYIFPNVGACHHNDVPFEPVLYENVISNAKKRIDALKSSHKTSQMVARVDRKATFDLFL